MKYFVSSSIALLLTLSVALAVQKAPKPYTEWSEKDAMKMLNNSAWSYMQSFRGSPETGATFRGATPGGRAPNTRPMVDDASYVNLRVRLLSARPIRQAHSRLIELGMKQKNEKLVEQLRRFATVDSPEQIVITLSPDKNDSQLLMQDLMAILNKLTTTGIRNETFIQSGGKRQYLVEYNPPQSDGFGARFVFARNVNGEPFVGPNDKELEFFAELNSNFKIKATFKLQNMIYDGKLEY